VGVVEAPLRRRNGLLPWPVCNSSDGLSMKSTPNDRTAQSSHARVRTMSTSAITTIRPLAAGFGAEVTDVDLRQPISDALANEIRSAFLAHALLVVRSQSLTKAQMAAFASVFGTVEGNVFRKPDGTVMEDVHQISNLDASGEPAENPYLKSNYFWHSDKSYLAVPALLTMLHAIELPSAGGDTQFADMAKAYVALPGEQKRQLEGLQAIHSLEYMRTSTNDRPPTEEEKRAAPPVTHPLVRTHPETGEKSLYIGMYCAGIVGMNEAAGRALLDQLLAHATQPRFCYTHEWQPGDLVFWDNRCLVHRAIANYAMGTQRRVLQRLVVKGTAPV
jgi:taurine dioxygenase